MTNGKLVCYEVIVENVMRNHPWTTDHINNDDVLEWIGSFMQHTNSPIVYADKQVYLPVDEAGRAKLPADLHLLDAVGHVTDYCDLSDSDRECLKGTISGMRWNSNTFHTKYHSDNRDYVRRDAKETYTVNSNYLFASFTKGGISLIYKALATDENGNPMVPADEQWVKAAEFEIAYRLGYILWTQDVLKDKVFMMLERERDWYFAQAVNYSKMLSVDEMETLTMKNTEADRRSAAVSGKTDDSCDTSGNKGTYGVTKSIVDPENSEDHSHDHILFDKELPPLPEP